MRNKKTGKKFISLLMVLCLVWSVFGTYLPSGIVKAAETTEPTKYTVELNNAGNVFLCNKTQTDGLVIITYTVESGVQKTYSRAGVGITTEPMAETPYQDGNGSIFYDECYLLEGPESDQTQNVHTIKIWKDNENKAIGTYAVKPKWPGDYYYFAGGKEGSGNENAKYFGIWFENGTGTAKLTNVTCTDADGNDLGLQTNSDKCIITGGEDPVVPTAMEYTVELNDADNIFLCNATPTNGPITIKYTVESVTKIGTRCGAIATTTPNAEYPYNGEYGSILFDDVNYILNENEKHTIKISKNDDGKVKGIYYVPGKWAEEYSFNYNNKTENNVGNGNLNSQYFGIWLSDETSEEQEPQPITAKLTHVTCTDADGKDLGLQTNSPNCKIYDKHGTLEGATVSLGDDIGVNFYMDLSQNILSDENAYVEFTHPDKNHTVEKVMVKDAVPGTYEGTEYEIFTCNIAAKEMASDIKLKVVNGSGIAGKEYTYQVKTYADSILDGTVASTEKEMAMVKAMLNYGAYAQTYFGYNKESLANASLGDADKTLQTVTLDDTYNYALTGSCAGLTYYGTSLMTTSKTAIRHYFEVAEGTDITEFAFQYSDTPLEAQQKGTLYYVEIPGILASKLGDAYTLTVTKGTEETMTLTYSPYTNVKGVLAGSFEAPDKNMMTALYWYGVAATDLKNAN